ncbi:MAG: alpha/beta hydrolase [Pseudomonadales bacterium]|nr:alpha/beta hydrolase [Pseudomonadales bacterium]
MNKHRIETNNVNCNGISLHYIDEGNINNPPILLVMGLGAQLTQWPQKMVDALVEEGFRVIRFDNRDIGLSAQTSKNIRFDLARDSMRARIGLPIKNNYTLYSMVEDVAGLLDALKLENVHIVGASMGGMISQLFSALYPHRTLSLTSIMSTTNESTLPLPRYDILFNLMGFGVEKGHEKDIAVRRTLKFWKKISSPDYPTPEDEILARIASDYERSYRPSGTLRQTHAIMATGGFRHLLHRINCPTQVIHGNKDPLVHMKGGIASAKAIPGSKLEIISGMGHDFPAQLLPKLVELITLNARQPNYSMVS